MQEPRTDAVIETPAGRSVGSLARGPEGGRTVLYVHGWPGSRLEQELIPADVLERLDVRLVSVDRPGYGNTDPLAGDRPTRARDLLDVCDALGIDRFPVLAFSAGASNAMMLAALAPRRVTRLVIASGQMPYDDVDAIATLDPEQAAELPSLRAGRTRELEASYEREREEILADTGGWFDEGVASFSEAERAWYSHVRETLVAEVREGLRAGVEGFLADGLTCVRPFELDPRTIACPVRAVHGADDDWEPLPNLQRVLAGLPDAELVALDGLRHFGPLLDPDLLIDLAVGER